MSISQPRAGALFIGVAAVLSGCKKDSTPQTPQSPDCSADRSILATRQTTTTQGVKVAVLDDQGLPYYVRLGPDTLMEESGGTRTYHVFDRDGDYDLKRIVSEGPVAGTMITETFFAYDSAHHIVRSWR